MPGRQVELAEIDLPAFGTPETEPLIPAETYASRIEQARARGIRFVRARPVEPVWRGEPLVRRCEFFALASISALSRWRARRRGAEVSSFVTVGFSSAGGMLTRARPRRDVAGPLR